MIRDSDRWKFPALTALMGLAALMLAYRSTMLSMVSTWSNSETFAHGFLIFPITATLIWNRRERIAGLDARPDLWVIAVILLAGATWMIANLAEIQIIQQLALIAQMILTLWAILGLRVVRAMAFPLFFMFFSVPFGDQLIPGLVNFTADFTVSVIQLTGIPIYRDGNTFSLPTGNWSVVEACSGIRYLIASLMLGSLFAYLSYQSHWKRLAFIVLSVVLPVVANGLRAVMIVMIGHFSGMKFAVGVDHLIYGWFFFGFVMLFMFWIGSFWSDSKGIAPARPIPTGTHCSGPKHRWFMLAAVLSLGAASIWPAQALRIASSDSPPGRSPKLRLPEAKGDWRLVKTDEFDHWAPNYQGASTAISATYSGAAEHPVTLFLYYYRNQKQGRELINSNNAIVSAQDPVWHLLESNRIRLAVNDRSLPVNQSRLSSARSQILVWEWYWVGDVFVASDFLAKLLEVKAKLLGQNTDSAALIVSVEHSDQTSSAAESLRRFVGDMIPALEVSLQSAAGN